MAGSRYLKRKNNRHLTRLPGMLLGGLLIAGCGGGPQWTWYHPDADYAKTHRTGDVHECESYADEVSANGPPDETVFGRNYGGWGNTDVELCMAEKGWFLTSDHVNVDDF